LHDDDDDDPDEDDKVDEEVDPDEGELDEAGDEDDVEEGEGVVLFDEFDVRLVELLERMELLFFAFLCGLRFDRPEVVEEEPEEFALVWWVVTVTSATFLVVVVVDISQSDPECEPGGVGGSARDAEEEGEEGTKVVNPAPFASPLHFDDIDGEVEGEDMESPPRFKLLAPHDELELLEELELSRAASVTFFPAAEGDVMEGRFPFTLDPTW